MSTNMHILDAVDAPIERTCLHAEKRRPKSISNGESSTKARNRAEGAEAVTQKLATTLKSLSGIAGTLSIEAGTGDHELFVANILE